MTERPQMFWGMIASMCWAMHGWSFINLPLIGMWVQLLKVPYRFLYLAILLFCGIGVYTVKATARPPCCSRRLWRLRLRVPPGWTVSRADDPRLRARPR